MEKPKYSTTKPNSHIIFPQIQPFKDNNRKEAIEGQKAKNKQKQNQNKGYNQNQQANDSFEMQDNFKFEDNSNARA